MLHVQYYIHSEEQIEELSQEPFNFLTRSADLFNYWNWLYDYMSGKMIN